MNEVVCMKKRKKTAIIIASVLVLCWTSMVITDYVLALQTKKPIFSIYSEVTDADRYRGLGYTIFLKYQGPVGMPGEQLKGYFYWGWR